MRTKILFAFLILIILFLCFRRSNFFLSATLPFKVTVVQSAETKELDALWAQALALFKAKDYDKLDQFAAKLRSSKGGYADGYWKISVVYYGLTLSRDKPDARWQERLAALRDWVAAKPNSITARVALANVLKDYAWKARGGEYASQVSDNGWRLFGERLNEARKTLDEAELLDEKCPMSWSVMMTVAMGLNLSKDRFNTIFNQAINYEPGYEAYYFDKAIFLLPRWAGSKGEWENSLTKSADMIGGDDGDVLYARVVWNMNQSIGFKNIFQENNLSWPRVKKGLELIQKRYPDSLALKNEGAFLAVLAHDAETARKYFDQTKGQMDVTIWSDQNEFLRFANYIYTH